MLTAGVFLLTVEEQTADEAFTLRFDTPLFLRIIFRPGRGVTFWKASANKIASLIFGPGFLFIVGQSKSLINQIIVNSVIVHSL